MPDDTEKGPAADFDPQFQTEKIAFDREQLVECGKCGRPNAPNRFECLYCGHALPSGNSFETEGLRKPESWEPAFNVIKSAGGQSVAEGAARLLDIDGETLSTILRTPVLMPLMRVASKTAAEKLCESLSELGLKAEVVPDADLSLSGPPLRLSEMSMDGETVTVTNFNTGERSMHPFEDLVLLVKGRVRTSRLDSIEKRGRKGSTKLLDESATSSDSFILDLYVRQDPRGYRVQETGFDFSCLGAKKQITAAENMDLLCEALADAAPNARIVDHFDDLRFEINSVWPSTERKDFKGLQRTGFGKQEFGSSATVSNLRQFTKFSRLQWFSQ